MRRLGWLGLVCSRHSSLSLSVCVCVCLLQEGDDYKEYPLPEQFVSKYVNGKFVTTPAEHGAG